MFPKVAINFENFRFVSKMFSMKHYYKNSEMQFEMLHEGERERFSKIFFVTCSGTKLHLQRPNGLQGIYFSSDYFYPSCHTKI